VKLAATKTLMKMEILPALQNPVVLMGEVKATALMKTRVDMCALNAGNHTLLRQIFQDTNKHIEALTAS